MARFCHNCGRELTNEDFCPGCGTNVSAPKNAAEQGAYYTPPTNTTPQPPPKKRRRGCLIASLIVLALVIIIIVIAALSGNKNGNVTNPAASASATGNPAPAASKAPYLELVGDTTTENSGYTMTINGSLKNNTNKKYIYVQITFGIYDAGGSKLGTALANVNNLAPDETWKFSAVYLGTVEKGGTYKLDDITAY